MKGRADTADLDPGLRRTDASGSVIPVNAGIHGPHRAPRRRFMNHPV